MCFKNNLSFKNNSLIIDDHTYTYKTGALNELFNLSYIKMMMFVSFNEWQFKSRLRFCPICTRVRSLKESFDVLFFLFSIRAISAMFVLGSMEFCISVFVKCVQATTFFLMLGLIRYIPSGSFFIVLCNRFGASPLLPVNTVGGYVFCTSRARNG